MGTVEKLIKKLTDKKAENRKLAIIELGKLGDESAIDPLITRLKDDDDDVRLWAAATLGKFSDERALEPLVKLVMSENIERVKKEAAGAVVKIVPSFNDVNIDLVIGKIESIYQEFTTDLEREAETKAQLEEMSAQGELKKDKEIQEKYFEQLEKAKSTDIKDKIEKEWVDKPPAPEDVKEEEVIGKPPVPIAKPPSSVKHTLTPVPSHKKEAEESVDVRPPPALAVPTERIRPKPLQKETKPLKKETKSAEPEGIDEFMSALKKVSVAERVEELSNVMARAMNLFVNAIDDISMRLTVLENRIEKSEIKSPVKTLPTKVPTQPKLTSKQVPIQKPLLQKPPVLSTRAALNEELKKVLNQRKVDA